MDIWLGSTGARSLLAFLDPCFNLGEVPHHAARRQVEAPGKFAAALHFVDCCFGQGDDLPQLMATDRAPEGKGVSLRELRQCLVGTCSWQGEGLTRGDVDSVRCMRSVFHLELHGYVAWSYGDFHYLSAQPVVACSSEFGAGRIEEVRTADVRLMRIKTTGFGHSQICTGRVLWSRCSHHQKIACVLARRSGAGSCGRVIR